jgi:hypothetical protein
MPSPKFKQSVSADGTSNQRSAADPNIVHHARNIGSVLLHRRWSFANSGTSVAAQIWQNHAIARAKSLSHRQPEFMIHRKGMQQKYRRAFAQYAVSDLRVTALYLLKRNRLH